MSRRSAVVVWALPWVVAVACGGRTGQDLPIFDDGGAGVPNGSGGHTSSGGAFVGQGGSTKPKPGTGGVVNVPGKGAGGTFGVAGSIPIGGFGNVGIGGFAQAGSPNGCFQPTCMCADCYSQCVCKLGALGSVALCKDMCFGAGGATSTGGFTGTGGAVACQEDGGATVFCPSPALLVPTCCTRDGCGLQIDLSGNPDIPLESGCLAYNHPGFRDSRCPDLGMLLNTQASTVPGCCRSDGTCGVDIDMLGLGCVQSLLDHKPFRCDRNDSVDAGLD